MSFNKRLKGWASRMDKIAVALFLGRTLVLIGVWAVFDFFNPDAPRWAHWLWFLLIVVRMDLFDEIKKIQNVLKGLAGLLDEL